MGECAASASALALVVVGTGLEDSMAVENVVDRAALAAIAAPQGKVAFLMEAGREGVFEFELGNYTARVAGDSLQGLYVASNSVPSSTGAWVRVWDKVTGHPEWFGARTGDGSFDNRPALDACVAACPVTQLAAADYWLHGRWTVSTSHRTIRGAGRNGDGPNPVTRVLLGHSTQDVFMVGTDPNPGSINAFVQFVDVENVTFVSAASPTPPSSGIQGGPSCVRGQYILNCSFTRVNTINGTNGFYFTGAVYSELKESASQRLARGTTPVNDYFIGCMLDGTPVIGANTGIASFYIRKYGVTGSTEALVNYGVFSADGFTDMFLDSVETSGVQFGISLNGKPSVLYGSEDCKVFNCVLDQVNKGIVLNAGSNTTAAVLMNNYVAVAAAPSGGKGIEVTSTPLSGQGGSISLIGNQIIAGGGNSVSNSSGVQSVGNILTDLNNPIQLSNVAQSRFSDRISNPIQSASSAAILLSGSARIVLDCSADGKTAAFPAGIRLSGPGNSVIEARMTGIDLGAVSGGASNKLISNGTQITTAGPFGSGSLAQGIMI